MVCWMVLVEIGIVFGDCVVLYAVVGLFFGRAAVICRVLYDLSWSVSFACRFRCLDLVNELRLLEGCLCGHAIGCYLLIFEWC